MDDDSYDNDQESLRGSHHRKAAVSWKKPLQSYKVSASGVFVHFYQRRESMLNQVPEQKKIYFLFVGEMETSSLSVKWSCLWRMGEGESRLNQESVRIHCFIHVPTSAILFLKKQQPNTKARLISLWRLNQYLLHRAALMKSDSMIILSIFLSIPPLVRGDLQRPHIWLKGAVAAHTHVDARSHERHVHMGYIVRTGEAQIEQLWGCSSVQFQHVRVQLWKNKKKKKRNGSWVSWELPWQGAEQAITSYCTI